MSHVDDGTLHAYLDGELTAVEAQGVEAHVAQCPACRVRLQEERTLIARADELLGLAAPPDRGASPPFPLSALRRGGQGVRLLSALRRGGQGVRLPLAWAATVLLALRVGMYLGGAPPARHAQPAAESAGDLTAHPAATLPAVRETLSVKRPAASPAQRPRQAQRPAAPAAQAAPEGAERRQANAVGEVAHAMEAGEDSLEASRAREERTAAQPPMSSALYRADGGYTVTGPALTLDSARALLGADPQVVPGLPVRAIHTARRMGYSVLVVVEQALDSSTTITVINGRPSTLQLDAVVVSSAARPDSTGAAGRALVVRGRAAPPTDSLPPAARKADAAWYTRGAFADRSSAELFVEVRGPLSADSLAALKRRLQPLRP